MIAVIEDKRHAVDAIAGRARRLVDQNAADHLIGQHNGGALAVLDLEINGCTVKLVFGICHRFNGIVAAVLELCERLTALRRHERRDQRTVESADLDGRIGDAHTAIILIHLDKLDLADRRIVELQGLCIAWVDRHRLRAVGLVELVARSTFDFGHHDGTDNTADADLAMFVCHITAIARDRTARGIDIAAVSVRNLKLRPRHSLLRRGAAVFLDDQISERLIEKL